MPPKAAAPPNPYITIKQCLSAESCSSSTLALLTETLSPPSSTPPTADKKGRSARPAPTSKARQNAPAQLPLGDRSRLAVEVINGSLRSLTPHVESSKAGPPSVSVPPLPKDIPKGRRLATQPDKLLKAWSGNNNDISFGTSDGVDYLAMCCSLSISFLISNESVEGVQPTQPLQTENARISLAGKLTALARYELALNELRLLKWRLLGLMRGNGESWVVDVGKKVAKEDFSTLLEFPGVSTSSSAFPLVIQCQLCMLRCVLGMKKPGLADTILPSLSSETSPLACIKALAKSSASKALSHITNLLQISLAMPPSISSSEDLASSSSQAFCTPKTAFLLQLLSIECLFVQRKLRPETNPKSLWEQYGRYLATFIRRTQSLDPNRKRERYILVKDATEKVKRKFADDAISLEVYKLVSLAASESSLPAESQRWTEEWLLALEKGGGPIDEALIVLCRVRLAVLELKSLRSAQVDQGIPPLDRLEILEKIDIASEGMGSISRGRKPDLYLLLEEAGQFRRHCLALLTSLPDGGCKLGDDATIQTERELRGICDRAFRSVVKFCRKLMSLGATEQGQERIESILLPAVDTVVSACLWGFDVRDEESWANIQGFLGDCWTAVNSIEREKPGTVDTFYNKLSTVFWQIFLLLRRAPGCEIKAVKALRNSISAMQDRPIPELISASIARKGEILGGLYLSAREYRSAEQAYLAALNIASSTGLLEELGERATHGESIQQLISSSGKEMASVGAILTGLVKIATKKKDRVAAELRFDGYGLSTATRGCLLEWCFCLAQEHMVDDGSVVRVLGERLLDAYELEEMPIRRSRIVVNLLELVVDQPDLLDPKEVRLLANEVLEWATGAASCDFDEDAGLEKFRDDVLARCCMGLALSDWPNRSDLVLRASELWTGILQHEGHWDGIVCRVDHPENTIKRLGMAAEFFDMKGEYDLRLAVLELELGLRKMEVAPNYDALIGLYSKMGLQYLRLGYSGKAGMSLGRAQAWLKKLGDDITTAIKLEWHLAYTEYLVGIGNLDQGLQYFDVAGQIASQDGDFEACKTSSSGSLKRVKVNRTIADAAYVSSLLAFEKGSANESLVHARRCIKLNTRAWAALQVISNTAKSQGTDSLATNLQALSLTKENSDNTDALNRPALWSLVSALHQGYMQTANIYRHLGMIRESMYYVNEALKALQAVDAKPAIDWTNVWLGDLKIRCGETEEGEAILDVVEESMSATRAMISFHVAKGNLGKIQGDFDSEVGAYRAAEKMIDELLAKAVDQSTGGSEVQVEVVKQMGQMDCDEAEKPSTRSRTPTRSKTPTQSKPPTRAKTPTRVKTSTRGGKAAASKVAAAKSTSGESTSSISSECVSLLKQKGDIQRLIAQSLALQGECDLAAEILEQAAKQPVGTQEIISQGLVEATTQFHEAFSLVASDPVFSVLQDSTISLPSVVRALEVAAAPPIKKPARRTAAKPSRDFIMVLERARDCIFRVHSKAMKAGSSTTIPRVASLLTSIIVLLSALTNSKGPGPEHPLYASYSLELQKVLATQREKLVVETDKFVLTAREDLYWPAVGVPHTHIARFDVTPFEFMNFQSEYVDIIPKKWAAVSVTMSDNKKELYITRFQSGKSQLMVRLPLNRHNSRDDNEEVIEYEVAVSTLKDIIAKSNTSTHHAKYMENKADRAIWWGERKALDKEMSDLLEGIEKTWLGGFKGIFSQYPKNLALFARFKATFDEILSKLPSRQKKKGGKVEIDYRILELFIALGNPEGQDVVEALTDLIFFVVDILQFHGEGNAYDEIDVDSMVVGLTSALTAYHEEAALNPEDIEAEVDHTILILDKTVQTLPWESMPCLREHSVSRLPSMAMLRDRINQMQQTNSNPSSRAGHYVARSSGSFILNPDSDLKNTQRMFQSALNTLPGNWDGITNRAPTEEEFKENLVSKDIMLYFGHGSGAHYCPPRAIRKLDRCAVTCLMGCSSGALKDAGEFEPYGMPTNYLIAGCPAILANLWDVTDKDIDLFTRDTLEKWGLIGQSGKPGISLVEAVASARKECLLGYLNGAAPVVYGIPTYVK